VSAPAPRPDPSGEPLSPSAGTAHPWKARSGMRLVEIDWQLVVVWECEDMDDAVDRIAVLVRSRRGIRPARVI
jgi:hypothetical protein